MVPETINTHLTDSTKSSVESADQSHSTSPTLADRISSEEFRRAYENLPEYDVAENVVRLRRLRGLTQKELARGMQTWQPVVARIEAAGANVRLSTLKTLGEALNARVRIWLEPAEYRFPHCPPWWECLAVGMAASAEQPNFTFTLQGTTNVNFIAHLSVESGPYYAHAWIPHGAFTPPQIPVGVEASVEHAR